MKAIVSTKYGSPEVLEILDLPKPTPQDNEIVIRMKASSVSSGDARIRRADPFMIRLFFGMFKPKKGIFGAVVAGEVEAVGKNVTKFEIGDKVYGGSGMKLGAHAEYIALDENAAINKMPNNVSFEEAAAIPFGGTASLHFLSEAKIQPGESVLVIGASGALGTSAIQLAKEMGAEVTGVCSTDNVDLVLELGADHVIDYKKADYTKMGVKYDVILETIGKTELSDNLKTLKPTGRLMMASADVCTMIRGGIAGKFGKKTVQSGVIKETAENIEYLTSLVEANKLKPVIDSTYAMENIRLAHQRVDTGRKVGNVIVKFN